MQCDFSFRHYAECIRRISASPNRIEMIHDIDFEPNNVREMAEIECRNGLKTTYFVRLHAKSYNAFSLPVLETLSDLVESYGHRIGLHFEPSFYEEKRISEAILRESAMLNFVLRVPITALSIHEPARFGSIKQEDVPEGMTLYCWDSAYYKGKKYISDSGSRWREGCMCQHLHHEEMIILTHPDSWFHRTSAENY